LKALHELREDEYGRGHVGGGEAGRRDGEPTCVFGGRGRQVGGERLYGVRQVEFVAAAHVDLMM
jgi:hypothetical protein